LGDKGGTGKQGNRETGKQGNRETGKQGIYSSYFINNLYFILVLIVNIIFILKGIE
jgi:hypothetical protein